MQRLAGWFLLVAVAAFALLGSGDALADKKPKKAAEKKAADPSQLATARELLAVSPRPARPALPPSSLPLELLDGERIAFIGNSTAERMNLFGFFETRLHERFPTKKLVVRNFAWPTDEVANRQRPWSYTNLDDPMTAFGADTYFLFFGFNESFAGREGIEKFKADYAKFLDDFAARYPRDDTKAAPRFVIVSPIAVEDMGDPLLPKAEPRNAILATYRDAARDVAASRGIAFADIFDATLDAFSSVEKPTLFTINSCHLNEDGDKLMADALDRVLFGEPPADRLSPEAFERLRAAVNDKSWVHLQDYRMVNGWYVYGSRRTWDTETFPREFVKLRNMTAVRDAYVHDIVAGRPVSAAPNDSGTGDLVEPQTRFGDPRQEYSENPEGGPTILSPDELIKTCTVPPGFEVQLFADESKFPEIANPVQLAFDSKGRLWVATMPSYPQWRPGDPKPSDKLVILEDTDHDGKADTSTVFYDKLHCPTGFQFFGGGVLVMDQPRMIWLADTDGDDKADEVVHLLDGFATEDTHHSAGAFEMGPGGSLRMLEGVATGTALETPSGPFRKHGPSGSYVFDPRSLEVQFFATPGHGNPWCYVFNEWGQGIVGDGTGATQHWDTPLSGAQYRGRKGLNPVFDNERMRPVVGSEFLRTEQFPDDVQDQFLYACVINTNGMPRWTISDDGAGYKGERVRHDPSNPETAFDLLKSTDKHFRPVDPQIGPDGALWFGDWANPLIGHMQYSQRDPNRDKKHGRIYRLVYTEKPLLEPETQAGKSVADVLEQLKSHQWRTRYRVRADLQAREPDEVLPVAADWLGKVVASSLPQEVKDRLATEVLWLQQSFHAIDASLLRQLLAAATPDARAAATRVVADARKDLPEAEAILIAQAIDRHPRVRTEAVRGLSFFPTPAAMTAVLAAANVTPSDSYVTYTADASLGANIDTWRPLHDKGEFVAQGTPAAELVTSVLGLDQKAAEMKPYLAILLSELTHSAEERNKAMQAIAFMQGGDPKNGRLVFERVCINCHKIGEKGADFGPELTHVRKKLAPVKLLESILDPNAEVDPKYLSTLIVTDEGKSFTGLLVSENEKELVLFDGKEKKTIPLDTIDERVQLKQSSMPDGLATTLSPPELLDVVEYLKSLK
jgi:putative heme-binding domain-containing protein